MLGRRPSCSTRRGKTSVDGSPGLCRPSAAYGMQLRGIRSAVHADGHSRRAPPQRPRAATRCRPHWHGRRALRADPAQACLLRHTTAGGRSLARADADANHVSASARTTTADARHTRQARRRHLRPTLRGASRRRSGNPQRSPAPAQSPRRVGSIRGTDAWAVRAHRLGDGALQVVRHGSAMDARQRRRH